MEARSLISRGRGPVTGSAFAARVLAAAIGLACSGQCLATDTAADAVYPALRREDHELLCRMTAPERDSRIVADVVFAQYADEMKELLAQTDAAAAHAGRARIAQAVSGKARATLEQVSQWELAVLEAYGKAWSKADSMFENLMADLRAAMPLVAADEFDGAARSLRRKAWMRGLRQSAPPGNGYVGDALDLIALVEQAGRAPAVPPLIGGVAAMDQAKFATPEIAAVLSGYEAQLDAHLRQSGPRERESRLLRKRAEVARDQAGLATVEEAAVLRWRQLYELNSAAASRIGAALAAAGGTGAEAQRQWLGRVDQAVAPWLFVDEPTDRQWTWMRTQATLTDDQRREATQVYESFATIRQALRRGALQQLIEGRVHARVMLRPPGGVSAGPAVARDSARQQAQQAVDAKFHELIAIEAGTRKKLEGMLNDEQLRAMRKELGSTRSPSPRR